jgi:hypothetical protein
MGTGAIAQPAMPADKKIRMAPATIFLMCRDEKESRWRNGADEAENEYKRGQPEECCLGRIEAVLTIRSRATLGGDRMIPALAGLYAKSDSASG